MNTSNIVVIGAGQAGARTALALREFGHEGSIAIIGDEIEPPYERPPLSKALLGQDHSSARVRLHELQHYEKFGIDLLLGRHVKRIQRGEGRVILEDGSQLHYDRCILATGGKARSWPGAVEGDGKRIFTLRTIDDAHRLRRQLEAAKHLIVIGGGFLGLECADSAISLGVSVTVIEAGSRLLPDKMPAQLAGILQQRHEARHVDFRLGAKVAGIVDQPGRNLVVELEDGERVEADLCLVAVGQTPNVELAAACGLETGNGIHVDAQCRTSDPRILAAGDCASFPFGPHGARVRLESWHNAEQQSRVAAASALDMESQYAPLPWFWTDQAGWNIQFLGLLSRDEPLEWVVRKGEGASSERELWIGLREGVIASAVAINSGGDIQPLRSLIGRGAIVDRETLLDPSIKLAKVAKAFA